MIIAKVKYISDEATDSPIDHFYSIMRENGKIKIYTDRCCIPIFITQKQISRHPIGSGHGILRDKRSSAIDTRR